jgi:hypothetical protein
VHAELDAAVKAGMDVLSFSISATDDAQINYDLVAIATFKAMERGIFVSAVAGNDGPDAGFITNGASWMLTVAAGTMDRAIRTTVRLDNGQEFDGESLFQPRNNTAGRPLPLVFPGPSGDPKARDCSTFAGEHRSSASRAGRRGERRRSAFALSRAVALYVSMRVHVRISYKHTHMTQ